MSNQETITQLAQRLAKEKRAKQTPTVHARYTQNPDGTWKVRLHETGGVIDHAETLELARIMMTDALVLWYETPVTIHHCD